MLADLSPLRRYRDFRLLFLSQTVSYLGSTMTYVAAPYQVYELTHSSATVGLISFAQLVPVLLLSLLGGSFADSLDRRKLLLVSEALMGLGAATLILNSFLGAPSVAWIFAMAVFIQGVNAFHRPALEALAQKIVEPREYAAIGALGALQHGVGAILGPTLAGIAIAWGGPQVAFTADCLTFVFSLILLWRIRTIGRGEPAGADHAGRILEGLRYAVARPELLGTYFVDIVAMLFAFPVALFPQMGNSWGGAGATGSLYTAMSVGALLMTVLSGWTGKVRRRGAAVVVAAATWGLCIVAVGYARDLRTALLCLALAGAADMLSGLFRSAIWNETIPNEMRGRLAGVEMISYLTGPLLGNTRAGWIAARYGVGTSLVSGGVLCATAVGGVALLLRGFWRYQSREVKT